MSEKQMVLQHKDGDCTVRIDLPADMGVAGKVLMALGELDFYLPFPEGATKLLLEVEIVPEADDGAGQ